MVNCFAEQVGQGQFAAVKRPGMGLAFQGAAGCGQGLYNFLNILYSVSGDYLNINATSSTTFVQTTANAGWSARSGMFGTGFNGKLWAMGGTNGSTYSGDVWNSSDGVNWSQVTALAPFGVRAYANCIVFNGLMWVMGGVTTGAYLSDVWSTPDGITWTQKSASAWPGRANFGLTSFNNLLWIAGGQTGGTLDAGQVANDVWSSVDGITWNQTSANAPWAGRSRFGFAGFNNKLRVLGGELSAFPGAGGDLWSSLDGITWSRDSSNPFTQAATGVYKQAAMTSLGSQFSIQPAAITLTGGAGAGAVAITHVDGMEEDGADDIDMIIGVGFTAAGAGYTSAPAISFTLGGGTNPTAYSFLNANGVTGDKRGMFVQSGALLYFFTFFNNGAPSSEIWSSPDGIVWTLFQASPAYAARDSFAFSFGSFWILSGQNTALTYLTDVWKGPSASGSQLALSPTVACLPMSFNQTSATVTHALMFFKSNTDAYTYNADLSTLAKVTNANYPPVTVPGIAYLDTFFFVMDPQGRIWNSNINDPTTWTALGVIPMQGEPNGGAALGKVGQYVVALGQWSTQFFYDNAVAAPASPLSVNSTLDNLTGCASGDSLVQMQSTIVWLGQNRSEGRGIFVINNLVPQRISTPFIDRLLENDNLSSVRSFATNVVGHSMYVLTLVNTNITLVYDFADQTWYVWTSMTPQTATVITSLTTNAYGLVTAISAGHGLSDGAPVVVSGAGIGGYNGTFNVNFVDVNTLTYQLPAALAVTSGASISGYTENYFIGRGATTLAGLYFVQHETNGAVYEFDLSIFSDFGNPIDVVARTGTWDGGVADYKTFPDMELIADNTPSNCLLRYTNDDYNTWSTFRLLNMAITRKHLSRNGRARRRAWEVKHTAATPFRVFLLEWKPESGEF